MKKYKKFIGIHILNHVKYRQIDDYVNCMRLTMDGHPEIYSKKTVLYFVELPKINRYDNIVDRVILWGKLINNPSNLDVRVIAKNDTIVKKALDRLKELGSNEEYLLNLKRGAYIMDRSRSFREEVLREGIEIGEEKGIEIGKEIGKNETTLQINRNFVIKLKNKGHSLKEIYELVDLSKSEIEEIHNQN
ncbi:PD-(D/E)XK nuclease family transposase [Clostridioides sp. ZZV15-6388]|uniref:PD-(D/E)XK nuclease family transposase n=1 Tax=Clostridioides sp. ZZV15-6388 TaxID=2811499 RepID=UPI001D121759|nr:PD-(D/E)XK nuclease family transposase [Clostridioides sp. ZZV15-6388]